MMAQNKIYLASVTVAKKPDGIKKYLSINTKVLAGVKTEKDVRPAVEKELKHWLDAQGAYIKAMKITTIKYDAFVEER